MLVSVTLSIKWKLNLLVGLSWHPCGCWASVQSWKSMIPGSDLTLCWWSQDYSLYCEVWLAKDTHGLKVFGLVGMLCLHSESRLSPGFWYLCPWDSRVLALSLQLWDVWEQNKSTQLSKNNRGLMTESAFGIRIHLQSVSFSLQSSCVFFGYHVQVFI